MSGQSRHKDEQLRARLLKRGAPWLVADKPARPFRFVKRKAAIWKPAPRMTSWAQTEQDVVIAPSLDWRKDANLFAPLDQGDCNTCTSHAIAALMGDLAQIKGTSLQRPLSPEFIHICLAHARCEDAIDPEATTISAKSTKVPMINSPDRYDAASCSTAAGVIKVQEYGPLWNGNDALRALQRGPVLGVMNLYEDFWKFYRGGVYKRVAGKFIGTHSVVVIGYDNAAKHWIIRNSQGPQWGEFGGYARIAFGECALFTSGGHGGLQLVI